MSANYPREARGGAGENRAYAQVPDWVHRRLKGKWFAESLYIHLRLNYWNRANVKACPKRERLAAELGVSLSVLARGLAELRDTEVLGTRLRHEEGTGYVVGLNYYLLDEGGESPESHQVKSDSKAPSHPVKSDSKARSHQVKSDLAILNTEPDLDLMYVAPDAEPTTHTQEPKAKPKPKAKPGDEFFATWEQYHGRAGDRTRDNDRRLATAVEVYGLEMVRTAMAAFFADDYAASRGHPVALFVTQIAQLAARTRRVRPDFQVRTHVCPHTDDPCGSVEECIDRQTAAYRTRAQAM